MECRDRKGKAVLYEVARVSLTSLLSRWVEAGLLMGCLADTIVGCWDGMGKGVLHWWGRMARPSSA